MKNYVNREMDLNTVMEMANEYGIVIDTEWTITQLINAVNAAIEIENVNEVKGNEYHKVCEPIIESLNNNKAVYVKDLDTKGVYMVSAIEDLDKEIPTMLIMTEEGYFTISISELMEGKCEIVKDNENVKKEAKELYEGLNYLISSLTKEDLKKLFTADTKDAFSLLNQMINDNFKALSQLIGSKVESTKMTEVYKKVESFKRKHSNVEAIMTLVGSIIKLIIGVVKLGAKILVTVALNIAELLILLVRGAFRTIKKVINTIKTKIKENSFVQAAPEMKNIIKESIKVAEEMSSLDD